MKGRTGMKRFLVRMSDRHDRLITRECDTRADVQAWLDSLRDPVNGKVSLNRGGGIAAFVEGRHAGWLFKNRMTGEIITAGINVTQPGGPDWNQEWVNSTTGERVDINNMEEFVHRE